MSKHTPGPWHVVEKTHESTADRFGRVTQTRSVFINGANGSGSLAKMYVGHQDADARLIAAAPELLEALICMTEFVESIKSCVPDLNERMAHKGEEGYTPKARAALARATGDK